MPRSRRHGCRRRSDRVHLRSVCAWHFGVLVVLRFVAACVASAASPPPTPAAHVAPFCTGTGYAAGNIFSEAADVMATSRRSWHWGLQASLSSGVDDISVEHVSLLQSRGPLPVLAGSQHSAVVPPLAVEGKARSIANDAEDITVTGPAVVAVGGAGRLESNSVVVSPSGGGNSSVAAVDTASHAMRGGGRIATPMGSNTSFNATAGQVAATPRWEDFSGVAESADASASLARGPSAHAHEDEHERREGAVTLADVLQAIAAMAAESTAAAGDIFESKAGRLVPAEGSRRMSGRASRPDKNEDSADSVLTPVALGASAGAIIGAAVGVG